MKIHVDFCDFHEFLKILDKNNVEAISKLSKGGAYYRDKGVEHNVFNNNNFPYSFIEIELIK